MAVLNTEPYHRLCDCVKELHQSVLSAETSPRDKAYCTQMIIEAEAFKREMRGIPRLKPMSLNDLPIKRARALRPPAETPPA